MTQDGNATVQRNRQATQRLRDLTARLSGDDLRRSLGGGWDVAFALVHLAFWDTRQDIVLRRFVEEGEPPPHEDPSINPTNEAMMAAFAVDAIGPVAVAAAERLDARVASLSAEQWAAVEALGGGYLLGRWAHRDEHADQIEAGLRGA